MSTGKSKGNTFERKMSRVLSDWMFNDTEMLWRDSTSGGRKQIYRGDIVPAKAHDFPWKCWPFLIELKHGYKTFIPTLIQQNKVREWLIKLIDELDDMQCIPLFISQFHRQPPILLTTLHLKYYYSLDLNLYYNDQFYIFHVYHLNDLLKEQFNDIMPDGFMEYVLANSPPTASTPTSTQQKTPKTSTRSNARIGKYDGVEIDSILGDLWDEPSSDDADVED